MGKGSGTVIVSKLKAGHFDGKYWVWADGKRTHMRFIRMAIQSKKLLPPGFFKACKNSDQIGVINMGNAAKAHGIKEMK